MRRENRLAAVITCALAAAMASLFFGCKDGNSSPTSSKKVPPARVEREVETITMNNISLQFAEYQGSPDAMAAKVDGYLEGAGQEVLAEDPFAIVVPHAGYIYSGPVAAYAYKAIKGKKYDTVVVIGPSHRVPVNGISVMKADRFSTPLGDISMDVELIGDLLSAGSGIAYSHEAHRQEHSVEVQLPFLQRSLDGFSLVMALMGSFSPEIESAFIDKLAEAAGKKKILVVASSDLSHYHDYDTANELDGIALDLIMNSDADNLLLAARTGKCELCGLLPVHLAMKTARRLGYGKTKFLHSANSGDTAGPKNQVVGYAALAFLPGDPETGKVVDESEAEILDAGEKKRLLEIARTTIADYVSEGTVPEIEEKNPKLNNKNGAFVTIKRQGRLRGCIGNFTSREPLYRTIMSMAVAASSRDPRFPPMTPEETKDMDLEISVLSPMRRISDVDQIEVGKHGLYIIKGYHSGTLLPQVATEYGWDRMTFLQQTCRKAGLPADAWKEGAEIYTYEAEVFGEGE